MGLICTEMARKWTRKGLGVTCGARVRAACLCNELVDFLDFFFWLVFQLCCLVVVVVVGLISWRWFCLGWWLYLGGIFLVFVFGWFHFCFRFLFLFLVFLLFFFCRLSS